MDGGRNGGRNGDKEKDRDRDSDTATAAQSRRPPYVRCNTDSQVSHQRQQQQQQPQQQQHKPKHQKRVVGGGAARFHARAPTSKALQKNHSQSTTKLKSRASSPDPDRPLMYAQTHRRTASDLRPSAVVPDSPSPPNSNADSKVNLDLDLDLDFDLRAKKNHSNLNLSKRNRSHVDIGKRSKSAVNFKRSSSRDNTNKAKNGKSTKNQVHFDLGNDDGDEDGNEDEWVDASASASPYLSRRGSVVSTTGPTPAKTPSPTENEQHAQSPEHPPSPTRQVATRSDYITSRLLKRTPSHGAPPQMSTETVSVKPSSGSPISQASHRPPSLYGTPKTNTTAGTSGPEELVSRFVNGTGTASGERGESGSYFVPTHPAAAPTSTSAPEKRKEVVRNAKSLANLSHAPRDLVSDEEDGSALVPRPSKTAHMALPASQSRTQQKLNLQRASSSIEPPQTGPGVGVGGASLLVGTNDYEHRDPRISKLLDRTGMEYLVVRRYQNPIARSIARLSHIPGAMKNQRIPKQNGNHIGRDSMDLDGVGRLGSSQSMLHMTRSRPGTPRRSVSIRTLGPRSSYEADEDKPHERLSGSSTGDANDDELATLLRNLWDKSSDLVASQ